MAADELRIVSLDALKRQMKIDFEEDDDLIVMYGVAAEDAIINATRRSYEELVMENRKRKSDENAGFPPMLYIAILMMARNFTRTVNRLAVFPRPLSLIRLIIC